MSAIDPKVAGLLRKVYALERKLKASEAARVAACESLQAAAGCLEGGFFDEPDGTDAEVALGLIREALAALEAAQ
jgi:hypothetical protein